ncbi:MAG TPA: hypothetical protein VJT74_12080 [Pyrinomonadaceae bacterium]|nr:hypothetical protein [Pyrinomonadaceae bacterium]
MKKTIWLPLLVGFLLAVLFYFLGGLLSGGGHSLAAMAVLFPYGLAAELLLEDTSAEFVGHILLIIQFPLYALLLANVKGGRRWLVLLGLLAAHIIAAAISLNVYRSSKAQNYIGRSNASGRFASHR